jgi:signal transduction histidine kinase
MPLSDPVDSPGHRGLPRLAGFSGWRDLFLATRPHQRRRLAYLTLALLVVVGLVDFLVGFELSLLVFYILPICTAVAAVGWRFGALVAVACVGSWLLGDFAAGASFARGWVTFTNAFFALTTYLVIVWLFDRMLALHRDMEARVRRRTVALTELIAERERLENALLEISERERRNIGRELHDGLGQHLTGTALAGQVLADKLQARQVPEEADIRHIVELIEAGIEQTRQLARGLLLAEVPANGLPGALQDFAAAASAQFHVQCTYDGPAGLALADSSAATHLFRITQEAVRNGVRHGGAARIAITLQAGDGIELRIRDHGRGLPATRGQGLGLRIMAHRAEIIGGRFDIAAQPAGGTLVTCRFPSSLLHHD